MNTRINIFLSILLVVSAILLISSQYQSRRLFVELERTQTQTKKYELEWTQLKLDQSTLGKHARIEKVATQDLNMQHVSPSVTQYFNLKKDNDNAREAAK